MPAPQERLGMVLRQKIRLDEVIDVGGMGIVYGGHHLLLGVDVAVKLMHPQLCSDPRLLERFYQEARAAARAATDGVVEVLDVDVDDQHGPFIVMERLRGESLGARLAHSGVSPLQAVQVVAEMLDVLQAVHDVGIVHRDLKPSNVFLVREGERERVKVLDFGIAHVKGDTLRGRLTVTGEIVGTPRYMSPEQAWGHALDSRSDLYSAGLLLWCCLSGTPPYPGAPDIDVLRYIHRGPTDLRQLRPGLPEPLYQFLDRAMAFERERRFASAREMAQALRSLPGVPAQPTSIAPDASPRLEPVATVFFTLTAVRLGHRFLLVREHDGTWSLPGGAVRHGESLPEAAVRSTREEGGIDVVLEGVLALQHTPVEAGARVRAIFVARPRDDRPPKSVPDVHGLGAGWFTAEELAQVSLRNRVVADVVARVGAGATIYPLQVLGSERSS